jgi:hypothetical protein
LSTFFSCFSTMSFIYPLFYSKTLPNIHEILQKKY